MYIDVHCASKLVSSFIHTIYIVGTKSQQQYCAQTNQTSLTTLRHIRLCAHNLQTESNRHVYNILYIPARKLKQCVRGSICGNQNMFGKHCYKIFVSRSEKTTRARSVSPDLLRGASAPTDARSVTGGLLQGTCARSMSLHLLATPP